MYSILCSQKQVYSFRFGLNASNDCSLSIVWIKRQPMIESFAREKDMDNRRQTSKKRIMENWFPSVLKILLKDHTRFKPDMKFIELHDCIQRCRF